MHRCALCILDLNALMKQSFNVPYKSKMPPKGGIFFGNIFLVELQGIEPWSGVGNDGAFYKFIGDYCRVKNGSPKPNP
jgi:hypothetical protein